MQRHIYNSCLGAYLRADKYAKPFYCLAFGLNMESRQIHPNILNIEMNMRESTIGRNILNILKHYQRIYSNFIFTAVCCVTDMLLSILNLHRQRWHMPIVLAYFTFCGHTIY